MRHPFDGVGIAAGVDDAVEGIEEEVGIHLGFEVAQFDLARGRLGQRGPGDVFSRRELGPGLVVVGFEAEVEPTPQPRDDQPRQERRGR